MDYRFEGVDTFSKMHECIEALDLAKRLKAFKVAAKALTQDKEKGAGYFILVLDLDKRLVHFTRFGKSQLEEAIERYNAQEEKYKNDSSKDIVLVSAGSVRDLKRGYPNYFSDTDDFEKYITQVYQANQKTHSTS